MIARFMFFYKPGVTLRHGNRRARRDCYAIPSVSRRPRRFVCPRLSPKKVRPHRTNRATSPTTSGRPARVTRDLATFSNQDGIFLWGSLFPRRNRIPRPTDQGFEAWPFRGFDRRPRSPESGTAGMCRTSHPRTRSSRHPTQCSRPVEGA